MPLAVLAAALPALADLPPAPASSLAPLEAVARVSVSLDGRVQGCTPLIRSVDAAFDAALCHTILRVRFAPAHDRDGRVVYGVVDVQVRLGANGMLSAIVAPDTDLTLQALPDNLTNHPVARLALTVSASGQVEACDVVASSGAPGLDAAACRAGPKAVAIEPARDSAGRPVRSVQSMNVGFGAYDRAVVRRDPHAAQSLGEAGAHFPDAARRSGTSGYGVVACTAAADGAVSECRLEESFPLGAGFGEAVLAMAADGSLRAAPGTAPRPVRLRVDFPSQTR